MRIVVLDGYTLNPGDLSWEGFHSMGSVTVHDRSIEGERQVTERAGEAEAVLTNKTRLTASIIEALPKLRYIGVLATGYDGVDTTVAAERGIPVTNIPSYGTDSVAQMVFAHILQFCHHVAEQSEGVRRGDWGRQPDFCLWSFPMLELAGKTIGIIGFGRIGRRVGEIATALGMRVLANDIVEERPPSWSGFSFVDVDTLLAASDVVSLNCPLTPETNGMINGAAIARMKRSALLINCARGGVVAAADLAEALNSGRIAGAGLDVLPQEPPADDNPLLSAKNCYVTPHVAWATHAARSRLMNTAVENLRAFVNGSPQNVVNGV